VCDDTGKLLNVPCPLCEDSKASADTTASIPSESELHQLWVARSADDRERLFRSLALRCHPDKFSDDSCKAQATRIFQRLMEIRARVRRSTEEYSICSTDSDGCPPLGVLRQRDVVHGLAFQASGTMAASCGDSGRLVVWKYLGDWEFTLANVEIELEGSTALATTFLGESHIAVTTGMLIEVWCLQKVEQRCAVTLEDRVLSLAASGSQLAGGTEKGFVQIWYWCDRQKKLRHRSKLSHEPIVDGLAWALEGEAVAAVGGSTITVWRQCGGEWRPYTSFGFPRSSCQLFDVDIAGCYCAAGGTDGVAAVWHLGSAVVDDCVMESCSSEFGSSPSSCKSHEDVLLFVAKHSAFENVVVTCVGMSSDSRHLASGGSDCRVVLWCTHDQAIVGVFHHRLPPGGCCLCTASINALQFSPDGKQLLAGGYDGMVTVWNVPQPGSIAQ